MEEIKFRFPSNPYDKDWAIDCLTGKHRDKFKLVRKGDNVLKALGYDGHYCISLPYDCLLWSDIPVRKSNDLVHGWLRDACGREVALIYFE